jgi:tyrosyl-tRNA synthetase
MYLGIDPTGPTLHLGHAVPILKLRQFQKLGHKVILLIGDFTGMVGDPTDKSSARKRLTRKEVLANAKFYKKQVLPLLEFRGDNPAELRYNSEWLKKLSLSEAFELFSNVTYAQTIKRDMFQKRIETGNDLYLHEFLYPVIQGYDSVALDVDGEVGGNDQTFNMLVGRDLMKKLKNKEKFVITMKLLEDANGKKMGKTEGNMVPLNEKPKDMFGKIMSWSDGLIAPAFEMCTLATLEEIAKVKTDLAAGVNPKELKLRLAFEVVSAYYGDKKAGRAKEAFLATFSRKEAPTDIKEFAAARGALLSDCFLASGVISSKSEWRRLVGENAVSEVSSDGSVVKISDFNYKVENTAVFKIGKHRFFKVVV